MEYKISETFPIDELVDRFYDKYKEKTGSAVSGKSKAVIKPPDIQSLNRKMYIANFQSQHSWRHPFWWSALTS